MKKLLITTLFVLVSINVHAGGRGDDPLLTKVMINQLEVRETDGPNQTVLEAQGWIGKDLHKLWIKADVEQEGGKTHESELQFLYSKAIAPYWDFQIGWRHNSRPKPTQDWLAIGLHGLAPYYFEIDAAAFIGKSGQTAFRLGAEYEMMLTQKLVLSPEASFDFYGKDDRAADIGSGLSSSEIGLRLRYEVKREFAPYIGINWTKKYGDTADFAKAGGGGTSDRQIVAGIRAWF